MKKNGILQNDKSHLLPDENDIRIEGTADGIGGIIVIFLCLTFSIINTIKGESVYEFFIILFSYGTFINIYHCIKNFTKKKLIFVAIPGVMLVFSIASYI
jgi:hypothetical protein